MMIIAILFLKFVDNKAFAEKMAGKIETGMSRRLYVAQFMTCLLGRSQSIHDALPYSSPKGSAMIMTMTTTLTILEQIKILSY
jgi:hypothetical protein